MGEEEDLSRHFTWEVEKSGKSSFERTVGEAVMISLSVRDHTEKTLNSREEWGSYELPELSVKERRLRREVLEKDPDRKIIKDDLEGEKAAVEVEKEKDGRRFGKGERMPRGRGTKRGGSLGGGGGGEEGSEIDLQIILIGGQTYLNINLCPIVLVPVLI